MRQEEIDMNVRMFAGENNLQIDEIEVIPKSELVVGQTYMGHCRNASKAVWDGKQFIYKRYKFGDIFDEPINHFEDDDGYDVFVPMKKKDVQQ